MRRAAISKTYLSRNVHQVSLGNGLFPTERTAELYGLSVEKLSTIFWEGVNTDYNKLQATGDSVKRTLKAGKQVKITNPNGTDIAFNIESRPVFVSDGVISPEDASTGGPACQVWLPAGEVYVAPVTGSAEGKIVIDRQIFQGKEITGLTLVFKAGKLRDDRQVRPRALKAAYDAAPAGRRPSASSTSASTRHDDPRRQKRCVDARRHGLHAGATTPGPAAATRTLRARASSRWRTHHHGVAAVEKRRSSSNAGTSATGRKKTGPDGGP
jgi:hypothetical protein